jgi:O-antigen/teichoic acid export membrane protein
MAITGRALRGTTPIQVVCGALLMAAGGALLRFWYGGDFVAGYLSLCVLVLEAVFSSTTYIAMLPFLALNRPGVTTIIQALSLPVMGLGFFILVPRFGLNGAAAAVLAATVFRLVVTFLSFGLILRTATPRIWPELRASLAWVRKFKASGSW